MNFTQVIFCVYCCIVKLKAYNITDVGLLKHNLFHNYDRQTIPKTDMKAPVNVSMSFSLVSVYELDVKNQLLSTSAAFKITWKDELLIWNPVNYNGLDQLTVTLASIWKPDVIILNSVSTQKTLTNNDDDDHYVTVNRDGFIEWWVYVNLKTHCKVHMTNYPFETQICDINVTKSYLDDQSEILQSVDNSLSLDNFVPNGEWQIFPLHSFDQIFLRSNREVLGLQWKIKMKRGRTFYTWNFLMPSISLSIADCFSFLLPAKSSDKLRLSIFVFLANAVLIRLFNDSMPAISDDISLFGVLLWVNILVSGLVIVMNIVITSLFYCKSPKIICKCCDDFIECCKCKLLTKCCKPCYEHQADIKRKTYDLTEFQNAQKEKKEYASIKHGDISISINEGIDQTFIHHRGMKIQLGTITDYLDVKERIEWADVSRNIDIIATLMILAAYAILYAATLSELLRDQ
ncbi:unnamed protein product [Mytilus coruscus]|uniref:Uncharacterized protein n=1 Tax=Mytilus coruscus TaxID=42192 RepID=A0A6J8CKR5_MYTCO|nr:unnamed protein product [Mytilus coruscus]